MIKLRHVGVYVENIQKMEEFYVNVFDMQYILKQSRCIGDFDVILGEKDSVVLMTKLITPKGVMTHEGDMLELLHVELPRSKPVQIRDPIITEIGKIHFALECDIDEVVGKMENYGGKLLIAPIVMPSGNKMSFIADPENNIIELIEQR